MTWTPHATVAVIVEDDRGRFLLVEEQSNGDIVYNQPAGHVEEDECIADAACRETLEETGWKVELTHFLGLYTYKAPANGVTYYRLCFSARAIEKVSDQLDDNILAAHWLSIEELQRRPLRSPLVMQCIEDYRDGRRFPLDIITETQT